MTKRASLIKSKTNFKCLNDKYHQIQSGQKKTGWQQRRETTILKGADDKKKKVKWQNRASMTIEANDTKKRMEL